MALLFLISGPLAGFLERLVNHVLASLTLIDFRPAHKISQESHGAFSPRLAMEALDSGAFRGIITTQTWLPSNYNIMSRTELFTAVAHPVITISCHVQNCWMTSFKNNSFWFKSQEGVCPSVKRCQWKSAASESAMLVGWGYNHQSLAKIPQTVLSVIFEVGDNMMK